MRSERIYCTPGSKYKKQWNQCHDTAVIAARQQRQLHDLSALAQELLQSWYGEIDEVLDGIRRVQTPKRKRGLDAHLIRTERMRSGNKVVCGHNQATGKHCSSVILPRPTQGRTPPG